jgi:peptide/nickel transport system substrate-binding protein
MNQRRHVALLGMVLLLFAAACGGSETAEPQTSERVLRMAFNADMQVPDPDIFYEVEGNMVMLSAYEGLVRYEPDSVEIEPALASSYTVSDDGLVYTFELREGVTFHDGTQMDAEAWVASFERRLAVDGAPAYMVFDIAEVNALDPLTLEVKLAQPVSPFLDYLAAPYGPKAVSPTALAEHDGGDLAQTWLATNSAGTGPYQISSWQPGQGYELTVHESYWGEAPYFERVEIDIIPETATQRLKLESGELDIITHGLPVADVESLRANPEFQVLQFPLVQKTVLSSNTNRPLFGDLSVRQALRSAFDRAAIVEEVYAGQATLSTQMYPVGNLAAELGVDDWSYEPAVFEQAIAGREGATIDLAYSADEGGTLPRLADILAAELQTFGFEVTVRGIPIAQIFELPALSPEQQPDLLLWQFNPDAAHPDTWARIFYITDGPVNFLNTSIPEADEAMDEGLVETDNAEMEAAYGRAGSLLAADGSFLTFADNLDVMVARNGLTGFTHYLAAPYTLRLADLREATS